MTDSSQMRPGDEPMTPRCVRPAAAAFANLLAAEGTRDSLVVRPHRGFTLIELLATIAIAAILAGLAAPSFRNIILDNRLTAATNTLVAHLALARSEAIKRNATVALCRSANPTAAAPTCGGAANDWTTGWLIFANLDGVTPPTFDGAPDVLIKIGEGISGNIQIFSNGVSDTDVEFAADGTSNSGGTSRFAICDGRGEDFGRQLNIGILGRSELEKGHPGTPISDCGNPS